ncbi:MAG: hypothetical protein JWR62_3263 [Modestobacter sp.]|jgi:hypothetical protein|nr:hypothetical protein [Modestobacter sp.]
MLREGPIPQALQGLLEYLLGFLFIAAPFLFGYTDSGVATAASIVVGLAFLVLAATSSGPTGLAKQLGPPAHALLDAVLAIVLIAAPFVLGFSGEATPRNLFLIAGVVWLLVTIGSRYDRRLPAGDQPAAGGPAPAPSLPATLAIDSTPPAGDDPGPERADGPGTVGPGYGPLGGGRAG